MRHPIAIIALKGAVEADEAGVFGAEADVGEDMVLSMRERRFVLLASMDGAAFDDCVFPASISLSRRHWSQYHVT
jgi:hypothetical protein